LRDQLDKRALIMATNLSDAAAGHLAAGNLLALHALARKYTLFDEVAYAFIEDGKGEIVAHTLGNLPAELREGRSGGGGRQAYRRELSLQGKTVYETASRFSRDKGKGSRDLGRCRGTRFKARASPSGSLPWSARRRAAIFWHTDCPADRHLTKIADKVTMGDRETSVTGTA
jgi:hypothetical protein